VHRTEHPKQTLSTLWELQQLAELEELDETNIQDLGNWNLNTRREVYFAELPMKTMRIMAGHSDQKASFFVARSLIEPPETLQNKIFPFIEEACESIQVVPWSCTTAQCFLKLLQRLRRCRNDY
jgi:hypothetical protein